MRRVRLVRGGGGGGGGRHALLHLVGGEGRECVAHALGEPHVAPVDLRRRTCTPREHHGDYAARQLRPSLAPVLADCSASAGGWMRERAPTWSQDGCFRGRSSLPGKRVAGVVEAHLPKSLFSRQARAAGPPPPLGYPPPVGASGACAADALSHSLAPFRAVAEAYPPLQIQPPARQMHFAGSHAASTLPPRACHGPIP